MSEGRFRFSFPRGTWRSVESLAGYRLSSRVFVAMCQTGDEVASLGPFSAISRLVLQGASDLVVAFSFVSDVGSAEVFNTFLKAMNNVDAATALAQAQRQMIESGEPASRWGGLIAICGQP